MLPGPAFAAAWILLPAVALALALADRGPSIDPSALVRGVEVGLALFVFPLSIERSSDRALERAIACAALGLPPAVLAEGLSGRPPFGGAVALAPLALLAAAAVFGGGATKARTAWYVGAGLASFGLPWLEVLGADFGGGAVPRLGALSPVLPGGEPLAAGALLAAAALAGRLAPRGRA